MADDFGDRMKAYEAATTNTRLLPFIPVYARIDGRAFSTLTAGFKRPYDVPMASVMQVVTSKLVDKTQALIGYTQSDEISLCWLFDGFDKMWFGGKLFKLTSILSSMATTFFWQEVMLSGYPHIRARLMSSGATFDCRVVQLPSKTECANMFLWRESDATKNAIQSVAHANFSQKRLQNLNNSQMQELLWQEAHINFNDMPPWFKRGSFFRRETYQVPMPDDVFSRLRPDVREDVEAGRQPWPIITRHHVPRIDMPSFRKVINRVEVIFDGASPITESVTNE